MSKISKGTFLPPRYWKGTRESFKKGARVVKLAQIREKSSDNIKMDKLEAIPMDEVKNKLNNLKEHLPDQEDVIYEFGKFLAGRLNPQLNPRGFNLGMELAFYDLQQGVDGFTRKPIEGRLAGYPSQLYTALSLSAPEIAKAVCPKDFAEEYQKVYDATH